jgi:hypothetical protein
LRAAEPRSPDPQLRAGGVAGRHVTLEYGGEVILMGPAGLAGLDGEPFGGVGDPRCLERDGQVADLFLVGTCRKQAPLRDQDRGQS